MRLPTSFLVVAALALAGLGAATAGVVTRTSHAQTTVTVTEREFAIGLSKRTVQKGIVRLVVRNTGAYTHSLAIKGAGVSKRTPAIKPGKSAVLVVTLRSGRYALWCPVPGHAAQGMKTSLSVGAASTSTEYVPPSTTSTDEDPPPGY